MNENKQTTEALDDILAEMRNAAKDSYAEKTAKRLEDHEATGTRDALDINDAIKCLRDDDKYLLDLANRAEAAAGQMRDAYCDLCKEKDEAYDLLLLERDRAIKARAALSTPPRNCDVGTPKEQSERFEAFCDSHWDLNNTDGGCSGCPLKKIRIGAGCEFTWMQMKYKEKEEPDGQHQ